MSRVNVIDGTSTRDMLIPLHMIAPNLKNVALSPSGAAMSKHEKFRTLAEKAILDASHSNPTYSFIKKTGKIIIFAHRDMTP